MRSTVVSLKAAVLRVLLEPTALSKDRSTEIVVTARLAVNTSGSGSDLSTELDASTYTPTTCGLSTDVTRPQVC